MEEQEDKLYCPNCGSSQLTANKKGFGAGKAVTGAILTGRYRVTSRIYR